MSVVDGVDQFDGVVYGYGEGLDENDWEWTTTERDGYNDAIGYMTWDNTGDAELLPVLYFDAEFFKGRLLHKGQPMNEVTATIRWTE